MSPSASSPNRSNPPSRLRAWLPIALTFALLSSYSCKNGPIAPDLEFTWGDKIDHFCVYALIAVLVIRALPGDLQRTTRWLTAFVIVSLFGMWDETLQHFNPARTGDPLDWFADSLGALTAVILYSELPLARRIANWTPRPSKTRNA